MKAEAEPIPSHALPLKGRVYQGEPLKLTLESQAIKASLATLPLER